MELMKEVSFIFDIHIPKTELFCKVFKENLNCIAVAESNKFSPRTKKSLLRIIIYRASFKIRLFRYAVLLHENKHRTFSLSHSTEHYSSIYQENYLNGETFACKQGSLIIKRRTQNHNSHNWFNLSGTSYFEMPQKRF